MKAYGFDGIAHEMLTSEILKKSFGFIPYSHL